MPASLKLLAAFVLVSVAIAIAAFVVIYAEDAVQARKRAEALTGGSVAAGKLAIKAYGCTGCHSVSGMSAPAGADGRVGPSLDGIATRAELAGRLANTPDNMLRWIQHPQEVQPGSGMPDVHLPDRQARDIAAYLYTLRQ
jgi:cytochrome c